MNRLLDFLRAGPRHGRAWLRILVIAGTLVAAVAFARAALPKIVDPERFAVSVYLYDAIPEAAVNAVALYLPWLELVCGIALLFVPRWRPAAGILIAGMLLVFTGLMISVMVRGIEIDCGCFSVDGAGTIGWRNLMRNAGLLAATGLALYGALAWRVREPADAAE